MPLKGYLKLVLQSVRKDGEKKYAIPFVYPVNAKLTVDDTYLNVPGSGTATLTVDFLTGIKDLTIASGKAGYAYIKVYSAGNNIRFTQITVTIGKWDGSTFTPIMSGSQGDDGAGETDNATRLIPLDPITSPHDIGTQELVVRVYLNMTNTITSAQYGGFKFYRGTDDSFVLVPVEV